MKNREFYIGYLPKMPPALAGFVCPVVAFLFVAALIPAVLLAVGQKPFARSFFEFGNVREFEGTIRAAPIPFLLVEKTEKSADSLPVFERIPLVAEGKFGADEIVRDFDGARVRLRGTRIYRDRRQMIEVVAGSVERVSGPARKIPEERKSLGAYTLRGEIVDSKCYLGVMNPGASKPHRECAVNCLRGGIPALFVVKDKNGNVSELWLLSERGEPLNERILGYVAEPVELQGEVGRTGDDLFLYADPASLRRLP